MILGSMTWLKGSSAMFPWASTWSNGFLPWCISISPLWMLKSILKNFHLVWSSWSLKPSPLTWAHLRTMMEVIHPFVQLHDPYDSLLVWRHFWRSCVTAPPRNHSHWRRWTRISCQARPIKPQRVLALLFWSGACKIGLRDRKKGFESRCGWGAVLSKREVHVTNNSAYRKLM